MNSLSAIALLEEQRASADSVELSYFDTTLKFLKVAGTTFDSAGFSCRLGKYSSMEFFKLGDDPKLKMQIACSSALLYLKVIKEWHDGKFRRRVSREFGAMESEYVSVVSDVLAIYERERNGQGERALPSLFSPPQP